MILTVSEARAALPDLLTRVEGGQEITITRHGRPVAVLVRPDVLRVRRVGGAFADAEAIRDLVARARDQPVATVAGITEQRAVELIEAVDTGRGAR